MKAARASKLTVKNQASVPKEIREFLAVSKGDGLLWEIQGDIVVVKKVSKVDLEWSRAIEATLSEWNSKEDDEAYGDL